MAFCLRLAALHDALPERRRWELVMAVLLQVSALRDGVRHRDNQLTALRAELDRLEATRDRWAALSRPLTPTRHPSLISERPQAHVCCSGVPDVDQLPTLKLDLLCPDHYCTRASPRCMRY